MNTNKIDKLCAAIDAQDPPAIARQIAKIENYDQIGSKGASPLMTACYRHDHQTMLKLLNAGADPDYSGQNISPLMSILSLSSLNSRHDRTTEKSLKTMEILLQAGADVDQVSGTDLATPLMTVERPEQLERLLKAYPNLNQKDADQNTALHRLVKKSHMYRHPAVNMEFDQIIEMIEMLIKQGADITIKNTHGETAGDLLPPPTNRLGTNPYLKALFDKGNDAQTRETYRGFRNQVQELRITERAKQIRKTIGQGKKIGIKRRI